MLGFGDDVRGMDTEAVDECTRHYFVVREPFDRLPLVMDDAAPRAPGGL